LREYDLKEQSQYALARIGANSLVRGDYGKKQACGLEKDKPKQSRFQMGRLLINRMWRVFRFLLAERTFRAIKPYRPIG
jgi:hypothetical protein